jgi:L-fuconolactonase
VYFYVIYFNFLFSFFLLCNFIIIGTEEDIEEWKVGIEKLAMEKNIYCKIGAHEEWGVSNPHPLLDHAVKCFGFNRLLYESNWFVSKACGFTYNVCVDTTKDAMIRNGATEDDLKDVFVRNAEKVYKL